jgi:drug/metabolite transporter (DMT)-like permease
VLRHPLAIAASLLFAIALWGGNNAGTKFLVGSAHWPPALTGATRFLCAGVLLLAVQRLVFAASLAPDKPQRRQLWWRGGVSLAAYIVAFNGALCFTSASHVALYLGAAPVWALLWEGRPGSAGVAVRRYGAALLALTGVGVLLGPALRGTAFHLGGELLGLAASVLWTNYGRQCRTLTQTLDAVTVSAHTMWRAGALLLPLALVEWLRAPFTVHAAQIGVQAYCIVAGGVAAFAIWSAALRRWPTHRVYLFNNLIPVSTMTWAHFTLGEAVTPTFGLALALILGGVLLGQAHLFLRQPPD